VFLSKLNTIPYHTKHRHSKAYIQHILLKVTVFEITCFIWITFKRDHEFIVQFATLVIEEIISFSE